MPSLVADAGFGPRAAGDFGRRERFVDDDDRVRDYPWLAGHDDRFTLALVLDVGEVLVRHGYPAPSGNQLVDLTTGLYRALHPAGPYYLPPT